MFICEIEERIYYRDQFLADLRATIEKAALDVNFPISLSQIDGMLGPIKEARKAMFTERVRVRLGLKGNESIEKRGDERFEALSFSSDQHRFGNFLEAAANAAMDLAATKSRLSTPGDIHTWIKTRIFKVHSGTEYVRVSNSETKDLVSRWLRWRVGIRGTPTFFMSAFFGFKDDEYSSGESLHETREKIAVALRKDRWADEGCGFLHYDFKLRTREGVGRGSGDRLAFERRLTEDIRAGIQERLSMKHSTLRWRAAPRVVAAVG